MSESRTTRAVLDHHVGAFAQGLDAIMEDYTDDSVIMTQDQTIRGIEAIRAFFAQFLANFPADAWAAFAMNRQDVDGEVAYQVWEAKPWVPLGTDTFVIRDGKILYQTYAAHQGA